MTEKNKLDRRIARTRNALWNGMFSLLVKEDWADISVSQICEKADIARSSFYLHFQNKQELLDFGFSLKMTEIRSSIAKSNGNSGFSALQWLIDHVTENRALFIRRYGANDVLLHRFQRTFRKLFEEELHNHQIEATDMKLTFIVGGIFSLLAEWLGQYEDSGKDEFVTKLHNLTMHVMMKE